MKCRSKEARGRYQPAPIRLRTCMQSPRSRTETTKINRIKKTRADDSAGVSYPAQREHRLDPLKPLSRSSWLGRR